MSIDKCYFCGAMIDTDEDCDAYSLFVNYEADSVSMTVNAPSSPFAVCENHRFVKNKIFLDKIIKYMEENSTCRINWKYYKYLFIDN